jgi:hypothetical protein
MIPIDLDRHLGWLGWGRGCRRCHGRNRCLPREPARERHQHDRSDFEEDGDVCRKQNTRTVKLNAERLGQNGNLWIAAAGHSGA